MHSIQSLVITLLSSSLVGFGGAKVCPPLGRVLPSPQSPSQSQTVKDAIDSLRLDLDGIFSSKFNTSGVSIGVKSIHETNLLLDYHYTPPKLSGIGVEEIDKYTIYRVGSVSKMMPALAVLQNSNINLKASVLEYLPDLKNRAELHSIHSIHWQDITIQSLAAHLSGLPTDSERPAPIPPSNLLTNS